MKNYYEAGNYTAPEENSAAAAPKKAAQPQLDYALDGFTPPAGVTDKYAVRRIQGILGVKQDGIWGPQTQAAWTNQFGTLWQPSAVAEQRPESAANSQPAAIVSAKSSSQTQQLSVKARNLQEADAQIAFHAPKGIDGAAEIRQVQQRLGVETTGMWDVQTQKAWDTMRSPQPGYPTPEKYDGGKAKQQLDMEKDDFWGKKIKENQDKMHPVPTWPFKDSVPEISAYYDDRLKPLYDHGQILEKLIRMNSGATRVSLQREASENSRKIQYLLREKGMIIREVLQRMENAHPFYSSQAEPDGFNRVADIDRELWYDKSDIDTKGIKWILQVINATVTAGERLVGRLAAGTILNASVDDFGTRLQDNQKALEGHWNNRAKEGAFNNDGYIINQKYLADVKYGSGNAAQYGCGGIASYNAEIMLGNKPNPAQIFSDMEPGALVLGRFGTDPFYIADYFTTKGYKVEIHTSMVQAEKAAKAADANIYVYLYVAKDKDENPAIGGHYVAFNYDSNNNRFRFYNGEPIAGPTDRPGQGYNYLSAHYRPEDILRFTISIYKLEGI